MKRDLNHMVSNINQWFPSDHLKQMFQQMENQVKVRETDNAYLISVFMNHIEQPNDIEARFQNGQLRLRRTVQKEAKTSGDHGALWQSYYEHFERNIPLEKPIIWSKRDIHVQTGIWTIRLPKK